MTEAPDSGTRDDALPKGSTLSRYVIEEAIGRGGFGIVYRARHEDLDSTVAIKEYLPAGLAFRDQDQLVTRSAALREAFDDGLRRFRGEARRLIEFQDHPNIVSCRDFFRRNGTAYLVMEYVDGVSLSELMARREAVDRPFEEWDLLEVMLPLLEGLTQLHGSGVVHRDVKPSNILVRHDGRPVLIDFGAAKQDFAEHTKSAAPLTDGYAAWEQVGEGRIGPWTDVYAAGAVMWRMVAAGNPPWSPPHPVKVERRANAIIRRQKDPLPAARNLGAGRFRPEILRCIDKCLEIEHTLRPRTCRDVVSMLGGSAATGSSKSNRSRDKDSSPMRKHPSGRSPGSRKPRATRAWLLGVGMLSALALLAFVTTSSRSDVDSLPPVAASIPPTAESSSPASDSNTVEAASVRQEPDSTSSERVSVPPPAAVPQSETASIRLERTSNIPERVSDPPVTALPNEHSTSSLPDDGNWWRNGLGMEFVWVPPGKFRMGSTSFEAFSDERPVTEVTISRGFYLGLHEVTQGQWYAVMRSNPSRFNSCGADCPVENISWFDVQTFLSRLNMADTRNEYRLPTEAEWEYAARAGTNREGYAGTIGEIAWYDQNSGLQTHRVGLKMPNELGLYDMLGNVSEWVQDRYGPYPGRPVTNPAGRRGGGSYRVIRGGAWLDDAQYCRPARRGGNDPGTGISFLGFRVARTG